MLIYLLRNKINKKIYIGQTTVTLRDRWCSHLNDAARNASCPVDKALFKYGAINFDIVVIDSSAQTQHELDDLEGFYIQLLGATDYDVGYNLRTGGGSHGKHANSTKEKLSLFRKGKTYETLFGTEKALKLKDNKRLEIKNRSDKWRKSCGRSGRKWITNGVLSTLINEADPLPRNWIYGRGRWNQISPRKQGKWITNGITSYRILRTDTLPANYTYGRTISFSHKQRLRHSIVLMNDRKKVQVSG